MNPLFQAVSDSRALFLYKDWIGEGMEPVNRELAESRSEVCLHGENGKACHQNIGGKWWETAKHEIALVIREQMEIKKKLDLKLPGDEELFICNACGCPLPLKPWVPIKHIKKHTGQSEMQAFTPFCWIRRELMNL